MPIKKTPPKSKPEPQYRRKRPELGKGESFSSSSSSSSSTADFAHAKPLEPRHFELREDGTIWKTDESHPPSSALHPQLPKGEGGRSTEQLAPSLIFSHDNPFLRLYQGNCFQLLDAIAAKYPHGRFNAIFADPPYFLSNGGITCHAGRMVKVDKGDWDKSRCSHAKADRIIF